GSASYQNENKRDDRVRTQSRIYDVVQDTLEKMTLAGGRDTEKDFFGRKGGYPTILSKRTVGTSCPYCGSIIQKMNYLGGTVYFCPLCQKA
ncbi:MAG: endonuclease VIII, partial [Acetatifactor sp.]|nr:endonuclease VIII [Acetatifactor sp.]